MEQVNSAKTFFDFPERLSNEEVLSEILRFKHNSLLNQLLEGYQELAVIINKERQLVAFNSKALEAFRASDYFEIIGKRIGEAIHCIHSDANESGCGTSYFCRECGAARAIKRTSEKEVVSNEECRISVSVEGNIVSLDFLVHTQPILFDGNHYTLFTVKDISSDKRKDALERIFFHDVLNTIQAIKGLTEILPDLNDEESKQSITSAIISSTKQLSHEIKAQSALRSAEDGRLEPDFTITTANRILEGVAELYQNNPSYNDRKLIIEYSDEVFQFTTDIALAVRSLGNLTKNALEASSADEKVVIKTGKIENEIAFHVHNYKVIPDYIQHQLFQRSFSTKKNKGHGIGLYSVKLIVQQYLKGRINFVSNETERTVFSIYLPQNITGISL